MRGHLLRSVTGFLLLGTGGLFLCGLPHLAGVFILGVLAACFCFWSLSARLWQIASGRTEGAGRRMRWGLFLRLVIAAITFALAAKVGHGAILTAAAAFLGAWGMFLVILVLSQLRADNINI
ncbi:hypothetical protein [uncultured Mitsuokella sp.]|uniref:hypothetical protein n=1 Tax=uncultured Mitsuokella sp. TaxID=453120 RepID=UPI00266F5B1A|nr:hypothetical protein [uncultured Mitsuokella sp.]